MNKRIATIWLSLAMLLGLIVIIIEIPIIVEGPEIIYVDDEPGEGPRNPKENYTTIQEAINNANPGDTVFVYSGTYYENVIVNKRVNLMGENRDNTTIDGMGNDDVVYINVDKVNVTGFTIRNSSNNINKAAVKLYSTHYSIIANNNISSYHYHGICDTMNSNRNIIKNNNIFSNPQRGIILDTSFNDIIENNITFNGGRGVSLNGPSNKLLYNNISRNGWDGVCIGGTSGNLVKGNTIFSNPLYGIRFSGLGDNNDIIDNTIFLNGDGVMLWSSSNNDILSNNIYSNTGSGIYLGSYSELNTIAGNNISNNVNGVMIEHPFGNDNTITDNKIWENNIGIKLWGSTFNEFINNNIWANKYGIYIGEYANNLTLHHNYIINNVNQVYLDKATCSDIVWDDGGGEGNYWSDYFGLDDGSGGRTAGDGVGDTEIPHPIIDYGNGYYQLDNFPLIKNLMLLYHGWNLISIPLIQEEQELTTVLAPIEGLYDIVQWFNATDAKDPWKHHKVGKPQGNDLFELNETMGFWIYIAPPGGTIFFYNGTKPTDNQTISIHPGWNMLGYPSLGDKNRTEGLNNLNFSKDIDAILSYDAHAQKWEKMGEMDHFQIGRGYYIHSKGKKTWEVPL
ncbi:MAG: right-handed parallel beta-helix repeat-containing protein [Thermoplasmata archaeon]|nr:MAG: right-handed parallel beta-helix repeat-containing protein [Thermoplasmata archaeon]